jgi:hypothetical protein
MIPDPKYLAKKNAQDGTPNFGYFCAIIGNMEPEKN